MEFASRKRPRRFVLVAAVIALSAAIFAAVQAPLRAQSQPRLVIRVGDKPYTVTASELEAASDRQGPFTQRDRAGNKNPVATERATSLKALLDAADAPSGTRFVVLPLKNGGRRSYDRGDAIAFWYDSGARRINWFREYAGGNDVNKPEEGIDLEEFDGHTGNRLSVTLTGPEKTRATEAAEFEANVQKGRSGESFTYDWNFGDGNTTRTKTNTVSHEFARKDEYPVSVVVSGSKDSLGEDAITLNVRKKPPASNNNGGGGGGGGGGGSSGGGGGGSSGGGGAGGGGSVPSTPGFDPGATPPNSGTPALPPPSTSPLPSDGSRGPNLDPTAPPATADTPLGQDVTGILVSTSTPPRPGQQAGGAKAPDAAAQEKKKDDEAIDWRLATGIALTTLLVILGAFLERRPVRRLLPQPQ